MAREVQLTDLDSIVQLLMDNIDQGQKHCNLTLDESKILINTIHAKIDETTQNLVNIKKHKEVLTWHKSCQLGCHCDFYLGILEKDLSDTKIKSTYVKLKIQANKTTAKQKSLCLEKSKHLCTSKLFKALSNEARDFSPAPGI
jgi:hypothetical protein